MENSPAGKGGQHLVCIRPRAWKPKARAEILLSAGWGCWGTQRLSEADMKEERSGRRRGKETLLPFVPHCGRHFSKVTFFFDSHLHRGKCSFPFYR